MLLQTYVNTGQIRGIQYFASSGTSLGDLVAANNGLEWSGDDITGVTGSGSNGTNGEACTGWADTTSTHSFVPCDGAPIRGTDGAGQPIFSDPHTIVSHGRPHFFAGVQRASACDDIGVGNLLAGATCPPFCFWVSYQCGGSSSADGTVVLSWGAPSYGGTPANAPYVSVQATTSSIILRFQFVGGTSERLNITLSTNDQQTYTLLVVSRGHNQPMWIRLLREDTWSTIVDSSAFAIADGANTDLQGLTRVCMGGLYAGNGTNIAETTRSIKVFGFGQCVPPSDVVARATFIAELEARLFERFGVPLRPILRDRAVIVNSSTPGFSAPATITGNNIMHPSLYEADGAFKMLIADHNDEMITQVNCSGNPMVPANWTIVATDITLDSLNAAGGHTGNGHVGSPNVVSLGGGNFTVFVHAENDQYDHHTYALTGTAFNDEGVTWSWANGAQPLSDPPDESHVYMRPFRYGGRWYGVANGAILLVGPTEAAAPNGVGPYTEIANEALWYGPLSGGLAGRVRHCGPLVIGNVLLLAYTCTEEFEYIKLAACDLSVSADPEDWRLVHPVTGGTDSEYVWIGPYLQAEGATLQWEKSATGAIGPTVRQLRDPHFYVANDSTIYMAWAVRGEDGIGIANATLEVGFRMDELPF